MLRLFASGLIGMVVSAGAAMAQCTATIPYPLVSGTTASASDVMGDFSWINNCVGGTNLSVGPDTGRFDANAIRFQQTSADANAYITVMPNGASNVSGLRLYNSSNSTNVADLDLHVTGDTATMQASTFGTGTAVTTLNISVPTVEFTGIGTTAAAANANLNSAGALLKSTSSGRYKRDIRPLSWEEERKVLDLVPVSFRSKAPADDPNRVFDGLTAEQVAQHLPQFVNYIKGPDGKDIPDGVQYDRIASVALLGVVEHQQKEIEALRACRLLCMVEEAVRLRAAP